ALVRGIHRSRLHDTLEGVAQIDGVLDAAPRGLRPDQRARASAPCSDLDERAAVQLRGLLHQVPELEAAILVHQRRAANLGIDVLKLSIFGPRSIRRLRGYDAVDAALVVVGRRRRM